MIKIKKSNNKGAEIPTGSMSDIAFLLLLFFLVSTVIDVDTGLGIALPPYQEDVSNVAPISKERMAAILVNENGDVLLNKKVIAIPQISENLVERIREKINLPGNKKLVVSIKVDRKTNYNLYIQTLDQVKAAYHQVREEYAHSVLGLKDFNHQEIDNLDPETKKKIKDAVPLNISIAEPEKL